MSRQLLQRVDIAGVFSSSPRDHLEDLFVPFQQLTGVNVEDRLAKLAQEGRRIAIVGPSGCGKSSLSSYVARKDPFASIQIQVNSDPDVARQEKLFGQHLVRAIGRWAQTFGAMDEEDLRRAKAETSDREESPGRRSTTTASGGASAGILKGDLGRELAQEESKINQPIPTEEVAVVARRMLELVRYRKLTPIVVIDDSDRWLSDADQETITIFFGKVMRWVADLGASMIVAVHERYRRSPGYKQARGDGWLEEELWIPSLNDPKQLREILNKRVERAIGHQITAIAEVEAIDELFAYYIGEAGSSLRKTLTVAQDAVRQAVQDSDAERITAAAARAAISGFI